MDPKTGSNLVQEHQTRLCQYCASHQTKVYNRLVKDGMKVVFASVKAGTARRKVAKR